MNFNNFTLKAQESVQQAFAIASSKGHQAVECGHLLKGILTEAESVTEFLFGKAGIDARSMEHDIERIIDSYPKVSGGEPYISSALSEAFRKARQVIAELKKDPKGNREMIDNVRKFGNPFGKTKPGKVDKLYCC